MFRCSVFLFLATSVFAQRAAQDAGQVLGLSVTERTLRNTVEAGSRQTGGSGPLRAAAAKANAAKNYPEAFKDMNTPSRCYKAANGQPRWPGIPRSL